MKLFDDVCDGIADAGDFAQAVLRDHLIQRKAQGEKIVCRAGVGLCAKRVAAAQGAALPEFAEQGGD